MRGTKFVVSKLVRENFATFSRNRTKCFPIFLNSSLLSRICAISMTRNSSSEFRRKRAISPIIHKYNIYDIFNENAQIYMLPKSVLPNFLFGKAPSFSRFEF